MNKYSKNNMKGGGGINNFETFKGANYQKGYGIGDQFRRFFRWIVPIFQKHAGPKIESSLKRVGEETINSMTNIAKDVISGKDLKQSAVENINNSIQNLKESAEASLKGEGIKRKKFTIFKKSKKTKQPDIFS